MSSSSWRSERLSWRARTRTITGPRSAAWERKWKDLEADLQDAVSKLPEGAPLPTVLGKDVEVDAGGAEEDENFLALQSLNRFVATDLTLIRPRVSTPRDLPLQAAAFSVGSHQQEDVSESESTVHSTTSDSESNSSTSCTDEMSTQGQFAAPQENEETNDEPHDHTKAVDSVNVKVDMKDLWQSRDGEDREDPAVNSGPTSQILGSVVHVEVLKQEQRQQKMEPLKLKKLQKIDASTSTRTAEQKRQNSGNRLRLVRHLWVALVAASIIELCLISGALLADYFWSPCRTELGTCRHLHEMDCWGQSCQDSAPIWASAWPAAGLIFLAVPMKYFLRRDVRYAKSLPVFLTSMFRVIALLGVVGVGAIFLVESTRAALHYADRCPMRRESSRCTADLCPTPPCRRESDFSPCLCGRLEEAELARALFLQGTPACQPYEWYTWQMKLLEELILQYEQFACVAGPLTCVATVVGGALLLIQLVCCPLVLIGQWGGHAALCVLLGHLDLEMDITSAICSSSDQLHKSAGDLLSTSSTSLILNSETGKSSGPEEASTQGDSLQGKGNFKYHRPWDGDVSPELSH